MQTIEAHVVVIALAVTLVAGCRCGKIEPQKGKGKTIRVAKRDKIRKPQQRKFLAGSQITIAYLHAQGARPTVKRSRDEAQRLVKDLADRLKKNPGVFEETAQKYSDSPTAGRGGYLGAWARGRMPQKIEDQLDRIKIGAVSDAFETPRGFQIVRREIAVLSASQIVIAWFGARGANKVTRNRRQAETLVKKIWGELKTKPDHFGAMARQHSDDISTKRAAGKLGIWPRGRKPPVIEKTLDKLEIDQISRPIATPRGFLILRRDDPYPNK